MSPYLLLLKDGHDCPVPTGRLASVGSIWKCPTCLRVYKLVDRDVLPTRRRWQEISQAEADILIRVYKERSSS